MCQLGTGIWEGIIYFYRPIIDLTARSLLHTHLEALFNYPRAEFHPENIGKICILYQKPDEPCCTCALNDVIITFFLHEDYIWHGR